MKPDYLINRRVIYLSLDKIKSILNIIFINKMNEHWKTFDCNIVDNCQHHSHYPKSKEIFFKLETNIKLKFGKNLTLFFERIHFKPIFFFRKFCMDIKKVDNRPLDWRYSSTKHP